MTDFSKYGVGAVLCQKVPRKVDGNEITLSKAEEQELKGAITKSEMIRLTCNKHPLFQLQYISLRSKALPGLFYPRAGIHDGHHHRAVAVRYCYERESSRCWRSGFVVSCGSLI